MILYQAVFGLDMVYNNSLNRTPKEDCYMNSINSERMGIEKSEDLLSRAFIYVCVVWGCFFAWLWWQIVTSPASENWPWGIELLLLVLTAATFTYPAKRTVDGVNFIRANYNLRNLFRFGAPKPLRVSQTWRPHPDTIIPRWNSKNYLNPPEEAVIVEP